MTDLKLWHWYAVIEPGAEVAYGVAMLTGRRGADGVCLVYSDGFTTTNTSDRIIGPIAGPGEPPPAPKDREGAEGMAREWSTAEGVDDPLRLLVETIRAEGAAMQEKAVAEIERDEARAKLGQALALAAELEHPHQRARALRVATDAEIAEAGLARAADVETWKRRTQALATALNNVFACFPPPWDAGQFDPDSGAWSVEDAGCNTIEVREDTNYEGDLGPEAYTKALATAVNAGADVLTAMAKADVQLELVAACRAFAATASDEALAEAGLVRRSRDLDTTHAYLRERALHSECRVMLARALGDNHGIRAAREGQRDTDEALAKFENSLTDEEARALDIEREIGGAS